ncbi:MAG: PepSY domain-containing protein [Rhodospirillaceae bacterium]|nr:PepSY domain-containing protein [Rhodospirillaceae bacterium]
MTEISEPAPEATKRAAAKKLFAHFSLRRFLGWLHLWTGIIFCIPFVLLGISGSVLMMGHNLPARFEANPAAEQFKSAAEIIAAAKAIAPEGRIASAYDAPAKEGDPAIVRFAAPRRDGAQAGGPPPRPAAQTRVLVDPITLEAKIDPPPGLGQGQGGFNFMRLMHDMHGRMLIEGAPGRQFVGWLGVLMCGLGLSGIVMWWPRPGQWQAAFKVRLGQSALRVNRELHGAVGVWGLIVFMIVSFSGVYIVFPQTINGWVDASPAVRDARNQQPFVVTPIEGAAALDADGAVALAKEAIADGVVRAITLPANPEQPYRVAMSRIGDQTGVPRATVIVDPWRKKVAEVRDPAAYGPVDKFLAFQRQLHAGYTLGIIWWVLVFVIGFLPLLFVGTGLAMWLLKRRNKRRVAAQA